VNFTSQPCSPGLGEQQQRGIRGPTLHKRERPGAHATPTRRSVCWGGLEMDGGEAVDQVVDMRGEEGFEWFSEIHNGHEGS